MDLKVLKPLFKTKHILILLLLSYIIMCQSCMKMRMSTHQTAKFFKESKILYVDKKVTISDHELHYIQTGQENLPTLVFVHGSPGSWDAYKQYLTDTLLLQKFRMIAVDRPGFGYSDFGTAENLKTQAILITDLLKTLDNNLPVSLIGHSMGGPVIVKMATNNSNLYQNLVILSGAIDPQAENPEKWRYVIKLKPIRYIIPGAFRPANDELWWLKTDLKIMKPELKKITTNITIVHGTKDQFVPYSNVAFMSKEFVNAKTMNVISIENANHFIPWTHYEIIRNALLKL